MLHLIQIDDAGKAGMVSEDPKKVIEALISSNKIGKKLNLDENYFKKNSIL